MEKEDKFILWLDEIGLQDSSLVGGKGASLGEMFQNLSNIVSIPPGFVVTVRAYQDFIEQNKLQKVIASELKGLDPSNLMDLARRGNSIRAAIYNAKFSDDLTIKITQAYLQLCERCATSKSLNVAVRSSATTEDLTNASFAGQQETFMNIRGVDALLDSIKKCFASLFTNRAICYRHDKGFDHAKLIAVVVQQMIRSDSASSGVIFTVDTETMQDIILISAGYGLGEAVVQGLVSPDEYYVFKPFLKEGSENVIVSKRAGSATQKLVVGKSSSIDFVPLTEEEQKRFVLTDLEILELARQACAIEDYYSSKAGHYTPMDIEFAKDGDGVTIGTGKLYIVQARPETIQSNRDRAYIESYVLECRGSEILRGQAIGTKIAKGIVNVIKTPAQIEDFDDGAILVAEMTVPDWEPIMRRASGIITDAGGRTCHAAIVARELGIPCIIGTEKATKYLENNQKITIDCSQGETGIIYDGFLPYKVEKIPVKDLQDTKTKVMVNVGNPESAFMLGQIPNDGVGIAPIETIINNFVGVHPYILLNFEAYEKWMTEVQDETSLVHKKMVKYRRAKYISTFNQILNETRAYRHKLDYFADKLAYGIARIASGFYPKEVLIRVIDPKAEPFHNTLLGGQVIKESADFQAVKSTIELECQAIKRVRSEMKFHSIKIVLPQMSDPEDMDRVLLQLEKYDLIRGKDRLEILATWTIGTDFDEGLIERFDGISLILLDELTDKSRKLIKNAFQVIKKYGRKVSFHSQSLDDLKSFVPELIDLGVDSICLFPESLIPVKLAVAQKEKELNWIS
jgi:pyruvate,water dikinase